MAYFFNTPDFYKMRQASNAKFDKQIDDLVQSGPLMQWARLKQAKQAIAKDEAREAEAQRRYEEERDFRKQYMQTLAGNKGLQLNQQPPQAQQTLGMPFNTDTVGNGGLNFG